MLREINNFEPCQKQCGGHRRGISTSFPGLSRKEIELRSQAFTTVRWQMNAKLAHSYATRNPLISRPQVNVKHSMCLSCACRAKESTIASRTWCHQSPITSTALLSDQHKPTIIRPTLESKTSHPLNMTASQIRARKARLLLHASSPAPKTAITPGTALQSTYSTYPSPQPNIHSDPPIHTTSQPQFP